MLLPTPGQAGTRARPAPAANTAAPIEVIIVSGLSGVAASRIAATGGMRDARMAGNSAAIRVTPRPTTNEAMTAVTGTPIASSSLAPPEFPKK